MYKTVNIYPSTILYFLFVLIIKYVYFYHHVFNHKRNAENNIYDANICQSKYVVFCIF